MTNDDLPKLARVLAVLAETFNEKVSDARAEGYLMGLSDLSIEQVEAGARAALKLSKFFPRPSELREYAVGSADDRAELAWMGLLQEIRRVGYCGEPRLSPHTAETVRAMWGEWAHVCGTLPGDGPELLGWAKRFKQTYTIMTMRQHLWLDGESKAPLRLNES